MRPAPIVLLSLTAAALVGCASPTREAETDANGKKIEYVWITPTGSNIPVRVRKDQLPTSDGQTTKDQDALRKLTQQGSRPDKPPGGN